MSVGPTIALLGVSGAGKSRLASRIVSARPDFLKLSAGKLLREALHTTGKALRTAPSSDVLRNQERLVQVLRATRSGRVERPVLLEAHAFIDNDHELVDVPVAVMRAMDVSGLLVLVVPPETIRGRRAADADRRRPDRTAVELARQQDHMLALARGYSRELPARMLVLDSGDVASALRFIDEICADTNK